MKNLIFILFLFSFFTCHFSFSQTWQYYDSLRIVYQERQSYDTALVYAETAIGLVKDQYGENDTLYINMLDCIMNVYYLSGKYSKSIEYCQKIIEIRKNIQGEKHSDYAEAVSNLASLYITTGNYKDAEKLFLEALSVYKNNPGENSGYASAINNLAYLYKLCGNYYAAEQYYLKAKTFFGKIYGEKHPDYAQVLNNLAQLYQAIGNYSAAEPLLLEAKSIRKEVLGEMHPDYAQTLNNLALLYDYIGNFKIAESYYLESLYIRKNVLGEKHPSYANALGNLALLYQEWNKFDEAESLLNESKNIREEVLGKKHPLYALSLNNLGNLYIATGKYSEAETALLESKKIKEDILGKKNPSCYITILCLAELYEEMGKDSIALDYYTELLSFTNNSIKENFSFLSEKEKEMYYKTQENIYSRFYSFSLKYKSNDPNTIILVYNNVIKNKSILLKSSTAMRTAILSSNDSALTSKYNKWVGLRKEIDKLNQTELSKRRKDPEVLEKQANEIEKELVKGSQAFSDFDIMQRITWKEVQKSLKPGEAAIEFINFITGKKNDSILYCALIVKLGSPCPEMIKLCEEKELVSLLSSAGKKVNLLYDKNSNIAMQLYNLIWSPLEIELNDVKTIYLSPSGWLHKISFPALVKDKNTFLCDVFDIREQSSTAKIALPEYFSFDNSTSAAIFGGINYNTQNTKEETWPYLEGTRTEAEKINKLLSKNLKQVSVFSDTLGNEANFKQIAQQSNWLHVSTHGFFYPDPELKKSGKQSESEDGGIKFRGSTGYGLWQFVRNKNPLMRSGLVFAGANEVWNDEVITDREDGMLTAQEVAVLDMHKCDLVVLSACETGLGDIKGSEGVYGLQRAFKMAGVKYIIMSLWQVPDKETVEFMEMFYKKLLKSKDVRKSFNETQKEMRKKYDPYYWGAFVLVE